MAWARKGLGELSDCRFTEYAYELDPVSNRRLHTSEGRASFARTVQWTFGPKSLPKLGAGSYCLVEEECGA
jgi:hypothetical protein